MGVLPEVYAEEASFVRGAVVAFFGGLFAVKLLMLYAFFEQTGPLFTAFFAAVVAGTVLGPTWYWFARPSYAWWRSRSAADGSEDGASLAADGGDWGE